MCVKIFLKVPDCQNLCNRFNKIVTMMIYNQDACFSAANFAKFHSTICEIPRHYYPQISYILQTVGVVVLTNSTSKYKEFIVTCNTKTHYIRPLMIKITS